jgi:arginine/ornithine N-succinyltransferase beta subunit
MRPVRFLMVVATLAGLYLGSLAAVALGQDHHRCAGPFVITATGNWPSDAGVNIMDIGPPITVQIEEVGTVVAQTQVKLPGLAFADVGGAISTNAPVSLIGPFEAIRLNVATCTGCSGSEVSFCGEFRR